MQRVINQQGFTLIEALVALAVVVVGLVGLVLLQVQSQTFSQQAHHDTLAGLYSQDLQERLRANLCYLSPDEAELDDRISDVENNLLPNLISNWSSQHFKGSRSNWQIKQFEMGEEADVSDKIKKSGYWHFNLEICTSRCGEGQERVVNQQLLVEYRESACVD